MNLQDIPKLKHAKSDNFFLLAGPCAIEGETMALQIAEKVCAITETLKIPYIFKGSFKKANRSRIDRFTGIGDEKALKIVRKVSETFDIPTVTDIHEVSDAALAAQYVDVLQIPAFLVRQTDLVVAAAQTGKIVNLKKGQFSMQDYLTQLRQMKKMGGIEGIMSFMPGVSKMKSQMDSAGIDESIITKNEAIILSMTKKERENPKLIDGSRKKRIANGSGTDPATINKLLKQFKMMSEMMKKMSKGNLKGMSDKGIPPELLNQLK